jgi:hypothetical protein
MNEKCDGTLVNLCKLGKSGRDTFRLTFVTGCVNLSRFIAMVYAVLNGVKTNHKKDTKGQALKSTPIWDGLG